MCPDTPPVLDPETVRNVRSLGGEDDPQFFAELVETFAADAPERVAAIRAALEVSDAETARNAAHALKSSAGSLGAIAVQVLAQEVEHMAQRREMERAREAVARLESALAETLEALRRETG